MNLHIMREFAELIRTAESIHFYNELLLIGNGIALLILIGIIITLLIHHKSFLDQAVHENKQENDLIGILESIHENDRLDHKILVAIRDKVFESDRKTIDLVKEWHEAFGVPIKERPEIPDSKRALLRIELIKEELQELKEALHDDDLTEVFDAFLDLQYVLDGAMLEFGMHGIKHEGFLEVHESNMSKLGANGKPIKRGDGKILKGPDYKPPELEPIIKNEV